ncbi:MAG: NfeD family protein [Clostridiaceae bacterium]
MDFSLILAGISWLPLIVIVAGLALVILEMFIPGFGAPGIIGVILLAIGIIMFAETPLQALIMIVIILAILGVALVLVLQSASKGRLSKHLVLNDSLNDSEGFSAVDDLNYFIGSEGVTLTVLRPSGTADFSGVKLDVVSDGEFIPKGSTVIIAKVEGNRIVVKQKPKV